MVLARSPGCAGQAVDAVSDDTQVKMEDAPKLLKNSKIVISRVGETSRKIGCVVLRHGRPCDKVRGIVNWQTKKTEQLYNVSTLCLDDDNF